MRLTDTVEDYLKGLLALAASAKAVRTVALARFVGVSAAAATVMLRRLAAAGLVDYAPYRGARLTPRGRDEAVRVVRRHRVLETFLVRVLGFDAGAVHPEAERLEHAASDELIEAMARLLGAPEHDPHGAPIPARLGA
ncbi:MAG TPA: metal-dependent transcriptional regulator [Longimicrobium sp.]|nr:metal-dependent transcriptional regulator [Longimicrobium sp.]